MKFFFSILNFNFGPKVGQRALKQLGYTGTLWTAWGVDFLRAQWVWQSSMNPNHGSSHHMLPRPFPPPPRSNTIVIVIQVWCKGTFSCYSAAIRSSFAGILKESPNKSIKQIHHHCMCLIGGDGNYHKKIKINNNKQNNKIFFYLNAN